MSELLKSWAAPLILKGYARAKPRLRRRLLRLALRLEGGEMRSATARAIMARFHGLEIGAHSYGCFDPERFPPGIKVGRYVSIGPGVRVFRRNHPVDHLSLHPYFYNPACGFTKHTAIASFPLVIGDDCWIGAGTILLPGCRSIGLGAVIGAGSIVTRNVEDLVIAAGNPARTLRPRFAEGLAKRICASRWWEKTPPELASRMHEMQQPAAVEHSLLALTGNSP